ncbi:DUF3907 family protein [Anaerobacillus alkaliphilus]|uniref:DUF3907 family protein n=1 Tax=Anaerobacillus alkaliphilus TaxID=1548597 RepID=A0A4Q0VWN4_9BACI|nr:DUF3907 family protein [Anaerobacillus alkaliphilus]RXJ03860.1 DUF3907 family protein [Anaerobacillus alkaliphilus]
MGDSLVKGQITLAYETLSKISKTVSDFLNETTVTNLKAEKDENKEGYYADLLVSLRRINVFCDEGKNSCEVILSGNTFRKAAAEKTLFWIYHNCVEEFFNPRIENWYEDSRAAYTGKNAIKFANEVPESLKQMVASIEGPFQTIREELEYYETDYQTKVIQTK